MPIQGRIPVNLRIFSRKPETFKMDAMWGMASSPPVHEVRARKAFAVDRESNSYKKTAEKWANAVPYLQKGTTRLALLFDIDDDMYDDVPNTPITGLRVYNLEQRAEGGRAYKVVTQEGYCYDLREDVLLEAIIEAGCEKGGILSGEWVWAVYHSQMRLVRVGSHLYNELLGFTNRKKAAKTCPIRATDLQVGHAYRAVSGLVGVFLGFVNFFGNDSKHQLWFKIDPYDVRIGVRIDDVLRENRNSYFHYSVVKSHSYIEHLGPVDNPPSIDHVRMVGETTLVTTHSQWERRVEMNRTRGNSYIGGFPRYLRHQSGNSNSYVALGTVTAYKGTPVVSDRIKPILRKLGEPV